MTGDRAEAMRPLSTGTLAHFAYEELRERLITLDILPGHPLNEVQLAASLGVGRTAVREALTRLECDHLVVSYPRKGTFATMVDLAELADVSEIRMLLEPLAVRRAAGNANQELKRELLQRAEFLEQLDPATDQRSLMQHDMAVHRLIYRAAGSSRLEEILVRYDNLATRIWCFLLDKLPSVSGEIRENAVLLRAIASGDGERASSLALEAISAFEATVRKVI
ncbi:GntR family transcriptional regulator [Arthrobacter sp. NQ7]|uniref:GntR family transcriptional regulator n=1 Tax=Arthrobacter sp. NQ7 TaxID=3032303 RepID=UPI00240EAFAE|nr:GntR family transcriptional regulator [Arthrobacter sp. NQ7]MDJ0459153.1 GntR family transcriptional regulator [Arthrobacter sp. NQ7]